jgi:hypothetical protein
MWQVPHKSRNARPPSSPMPLVAARRRVHRQSRCSSPSYPIPSPASIAHPLSSRIARGQRYRSGHELGLDADIRLSNSGRARRSDSGLSPLYHRIHRTGSSEGARRGSSSRFISGRQVSTSSATIQAATSSPRPLHPLDAGRPDRELDRHPQMPGYRPRARVAETSYQQGYVHHAPSEWDGGV